MSHQNPIEVGEDVEDSSYETDSTGSLTTSLASTVRQYSFENGRRYHKFREGRYAFPNDESEQEREDLKHAMLVALLDKLHVAPIKDSPQQILDLGCGTGIWAVEMGDEYPSAQITGIDLSPIQPGWVPPNVSFVVDDIESDWGYPKNHFDYIHGRHICMAIRDWPKLLKQTSTHLKPGAWIELQEILYFPKSDDGSLREDNVIFEYYTSFHQAMNNLKIDMRAPTTLRKRVEEAGFTDVKEEIYKIPMGPWAKDEKLKQVGRFMRPVVLEALQAITLGPFTRGLGWSPEKVELELAEVRKAFNDPKLHSYMDLHVIYGHKAG
ncbi:MAG: hypothetical protein M1819_000680 [Sarea resinae]|nr:MAG: hypothetical protein M1819_000680 [Sarea resinae]